MREEIDELRRRGIWDLANEDQVLPDAIILGGRIDLTLKKFGSPTEQAKVRFVAQGYTDRDKIFIIHDTTTLRASSFCLILSAVSSIGSRLFSHDVI